MASYRHEADALDAEILSRIDAWHRHGTEIGEPDFDDLALRIFEHQLQYNVSYARYAASLGVSRSAMPGSWQAIPPVPTSAYKDATLATFDAATAALAFTTSGTSQGVGGHHYMESRDLYDAALLAGFDRFILADGLQLRYLNLVPNPSDRPESSLGYMMGRVSALRGDTQTGWYLSGDEFFIDALLRDLADACANAEPVCLASTAFALVHLIDALRDGNGRLALPAGSRIMETGGFKGRSRIVEREALYAELSGRLGVPLDAIVAEYGMTELTSQYYDAASSRSRYTRIKASPPWLRVRVVGTDGKTLPAGTVGALVHVDLANRSSCIAIATEDLGVEVPGGFVLIGREQGAELRGCSLDAEELLRK